MSAPAAPKKALILGKKKHRNATADERQVIAEVLPAAAAETLAPPAAREAPAAAVEAPLRKLGKKEIYPAQYGEQEELAAGIFKIEDENPYITDTTVFPIPSRRGFKEKILQTYDAFIKVDDGKPIDFEACRKQGAAGEQKVQMYLYQQLVREYMRQITPYRGLLVYHGLGSGKTCSAIAAAEALYSTGKKRVIVMTPFSLRENFIKEITFCGFRHYRLQNFWVKLDGRDPSVKLFANQILELPDDYIKKNPDIWVPDFSKEQDKSNYDEKTPTERDQIRKQVYTQIQQRITFVNYNGITSTKLKAMACQPGEKGFFDDAVVIVDEIHNLTRLMQGTIEPYLIQLPGVHRRIAPEPVTPGRWRPSLCASPKNYKRGYLLYRMLISARNCKLIGLSGTPLINFPEELGILANLLHGYTSIGRMLLKPSTMSAEKEIRAIANENVYVDFVETKLTTSGVELMFTPLPEGTRKAFNAEGKMEGVQKLGPEVQFPTVEAIAEQLKDSLTSKGYTLVRDPSFSSEPLLPPVGQHFRDMFIMPDGLSLKNDIVLRKRIQGLISYYRGSKKELMPTVKSDVLVPVQMSRYQQTQYMRIRGEELRKELEKKSKKQTVQGYTGRVAELWGEIYEISVMKNSNNYRMSSRQILNFAFPEKITRPRAMNQLEVTEETGGDYEILGDEPLPDAVVGQDEEVMVGAPLGEGEEADEEAAAAEDEAVDAEEREEGDAPEEPPMPVAPPADEGAEPKMGGGNTPPEAAAAVPAARPAAPPPPPGAPAGPPRARVTMKQLEAERKALEEQCKAGLQPGEDYKVALQRAKRCLVSFARRKLMLNPPPIPGAAPEEGLAKYSAKYAAILTRILSAPGSSLVYSQFLDMEGIGIFSLCLEANGFTPIEIQNAGGNWVFSEKTKQSLAKPGQNRYVVFTGGEKREVRSMALKLFNARFRELPESLQTFSYIKPNKEASEKFSLESLFPNANKTGEIARVFCITSAGAEGLSLKNVRQVHIMEPYWNSVRTDQVKGRAIRICSHTDLDYNDDPELNQRSVEIFTYCSVFPTEAQVAPLEEKQIDFTIMENDQISKAEADEVGIAYPPGAKQYVITSDEYLYILSEKKRKLLAEIQKLMKGSAFDCQINEYENQDEGLKCLAMPEGSQGDFAYHPILQDDIEYTRQQFQGAPAGTGAAATLGQAVQQPLVARPAAPLAAVADRMVRAPARASAQAAAPAPAGPTTAVEGVGQGPAKKKIKILLLEIKGVRYRAVAVGENPDRPLTYDLYGEFDKNRIKRLGYIVANPVTGAPTGDVVLR